MTDIYVLSNGAISIVERSDVPEERTGVLIFKDLIAYEDGLVETYWEELPKP